MICGDPSLLAQTLGIVGFDEEEDYLCPLIGQNGCTRTFKKVRFSSDSPRHLENVHGISVPTNDKRKNNKRKYSETKDKDRSRRRKNKEVVESMIIESTEDAKVFLEGITKYLNRKFGDLQATIDFEKNEKEEEEEMKLKYLLVQEEEESEFSKACHVYSDVLQSSEFEDEEKDLDEPESFINETRDQKLIKFLENEYHSPSRVVQTILFMVNNNQTFKTFVSLLLRRKRVKKTLNFFQKRNMSFGEKFCSNLLKNEVVSICLSSGNRFISDQPMLFCWYDNKDFSIAHADNRMIKQQERLMRLGEIKIVEFRSRRHLKTGSIMIILLKIRAPLISCFWKNDYGRINETLEQVQEALLNPDKSIYGSKFTSFLAAFLCEPKTFLKKRPKRPKREPSNEFPKSPKEAATKYVEHIKRVRRVFVESDPLGCDSSKDFQRIEKRVQSLFPKPKKFWIGDEKVHSDFWDRGEAGWNGTLHVLQKLQRGGNRIVYENGLKDFQRNYFRDKRDLYDVPNGYLKRVQKYYINFSMIVTRFLFLQFCKENRINHLNPRNEQVIGFVFSSPFEKCAEIDSMMKSFNSWIHAKKKEPKIASNEVEFWCWVLPHVLYLYIDYLNACTELDFESLKKLNANLAETFYFLGCGYYQKSMYRVSIDVFFRFCSGFLEALADEYLLDGVSLDEVGESGHKPLGDYVSNTSQPFTPIKIMSQVITLDDCLVDLVCGTKAFESTEKVDKLIKLSLWNPLWDSANMRLKNNNPFVLKFKNEKESKKVKEWKNYKDQARKCIERLYKKVQTRATEKASRMDTSDE